MLTSEQKNLLITAGLDAFKYQKGINIPKTGIKIKVGLGNDSSACGILLYTEKTDDNFRMKFYYKGLSSQTACGVLNFTQTENYSSGKGDEMFVTDIVLNRDKFRTFDAYVKSQSFEKKLDESNGHLSLKNGSGKLLLRNGLPISVSVNV